MVQHVPENIIDQGLEVAERGVERGLPLVSLPDQVVRVAQVKFGENHSSVEGDEGRTNDDGFAEHRPKVLILLRNGGQVRRCGCRLELRRLRRLSGPQTLGQTVCTPRHDSSRSPINLGVVGFKSGVTQNDGTGTGYGTRPA